MQKKIVLPHVQALKRRYRRTLREMRKMATEFTPGSNERFRDLKFKADCLYNEIWFAEQRQ